MDIVASERGARTQRRLKPKYRFFVDVNYGVAGCRLRVPGSLCVSRASVLNLAAAGLRCPHRCLRQRAGRASPPLSDGWIVTLKGRAYTYPSYPGASSQSPGAAGPELSSGRFGGRPFAAPDDNLSFALYDSDG